MIDRVDHRYVYVNLGRIEAVLSEAERSPNETYIPNERIKVYVNKVEQTTKVHKFMCQEVIRVY